MTTPKIEPINIKDYTVKQSKYETVGTLPIRSIILGPSGSGKNGIITKYNIRYIYVSVAFHGSISFHHQ